MGDQSAVGLADGCLRRSLKSAGNASRMALSAEVRNGGIAVSNADEPKTANIGLFGLTRMARGGCRGDPPSDALEYESLTIDDEGC